MTLDISHESVANTNKRRLCSRCHLYSTQESSRETHRGRSDLSSAQRFQRTPVSLWPLHRQNEEKRQQITLKSAAVVPQTINASLPPGHVNTEEWWPFAIWLPFLFSLSLSLFFPLPILPFNLPLRSNQNSGPKQKRDCLFNWAQHCITASFPISPLY